MLIRLSLAMKAYQVGSHGPSPGALALCKRPTGEEVAALIIAVNYTEEYDEKRDAYKIRNKDSPVCPDCGQLLSGYDTRRRHIVDGSGAVRWFRLRRLKCTICNKLHLELPDFMVPKKHYEAGVIADVLCGRFDSCPADDSTIRRWRSKKYPPSLPVFPGTE